MNSFEKFLECAEKREWMINTFQIEHNVLHYQRKRKFIPVHYWKDIYDKWGMEIIENFINDAKKRFRP